jgi:hypothetical protein
LRSLILPFLTIRHKSLKMLANRFSNPSTTRISQNHYSQKVVMPTTLIIMLLPQVLISRKILPLKKKSLILKNSNKHLESIMLKQKPSIHKSFYQLSTWIRRKHNLTLNNLQIHPSNHNKARRVLKKQQLDKSWRVKKKGI